MDLTEIQCKWSDSFLKRTTNVNRGFLSPHFLLEKKASSYDLGIRDGSSCVLRKIRHPGVCQMFAFVHGHCLGCMCGQPER